MTPFVDATLINGLLGDPGVLLDFRHGSRALLFDLGDTSPLSAKVLLRVSHVCVSHTHMDHFADFDRLLRVRLGRPAPLGLFGPPGMIPQVAARLASYTWNLLDESSADFFLTVTEVDQAGPIAISRFRARTAFSREDLATNPRPNALLLDEPDFTLSARTLDHGIPSLAFAFHERMRVSVNTEELYKLQLVPGSWINAAKRAIRSGQAGDTLVDVGLGKILPLGFLTNGALRTGPGQKIAYVTDAADHAANRARIVELAAGATQLFIEATFSNEDRSLAAARRHLTAGAAGELARLADAAAVVPMHLSARYKDRPAAILEQVENAFRPA